MIARDGRRLRAVTLNTWKNDGSYEDRLGWMKQGLQALEPQVVFLQEAFVCPETGDDTAAFLATGLGMHLARLPAREKHRQHAGANRLSWSNLSILSACPLNKHAAVRLESCCGDNDRWIQIAEVTMSGLRIRFCATHFTHIQSSCGVHARKLQAVQLAENSQPPARGITLLGGDLNAEIEQPELDVLCKLPDRTQPEINDVKRSLLGTDSGAAIDHLFLRRGRDAPSISLARQFTALDTPVGPVGEFASDHAAVVADLSI